MIKFGKALGHFFFSERRLEALVICRIIFGLCLFFHYLTIALSGHVQEIFGPDGLLGSRLHQHIPGVNLLARDEVRNLQILSQLLDSAFAVNLAVALLLLSAILFSVGFRSRFFGAVTLGLHVILHAQNEFAFWGWGELIKPFLLYVILSPAGNWYSLDAWLKTRDFRGGPCLGSGWTLRLVQFHVTTVYFVVAWARMDDPNWRDGSMLYGILSDPMFGRIRSDWRSWIAVLRVVCFCSWYIELLAPCLLWLQSTRRLWVILLMGVHVGLESLTMVGYWDFLMLAALTTFLGPTAHAAARDPSGVPGAPSRSNRAPRHGV